MEDRAQGAGLELGEAESQSAKLEERWHDVRGRLRTAKAGFCGLSGMLPCSQAIKKDLGVKTKA